MRRIFLLLLLLVLGILPYRLLRDEFSLTNITWNQPFTPNWVPSPLSQEEQKEITAILAQPFSYLGKGRQMYAFVSKDQQYVLKFFKFTYLKPSPWASILPTSLREKWQKGQSKRFERVFGGYQVAYQLDKKHAGLLYLHLLQPGMEGRRVHVQDRWGFEQDLPLESLYFILQKKGVATREVLEQLLKAKDDASIERKLQQIIAMYKSEYAEGLYDNDHNVLSNTGFIGETPMRIDVGRLRKNDAYKQPSVYKKDLEKIVYERIDKWLKANLPEQRARILSNLSQNF